MIVFNILVIVLFAWIVWRLRTDRRHRHMRIAAWAVIVANLLGLIVNIILFKHGL